MSMTNLRDLIGGASCIAASVDYSGSIDKELFETFCDVVDKLSELAEIIVIPFNHDVDESLVFKWKKGMMLPITYHSVGGTDYDAPTRYVNDRKDIDVHVILTDMQAPKPIPSSVLRIWVTNEVGKQRCPLATEESIVVIP